MRREANDQRSPQSAAVTTKRSAPLSPSSLRDKLSSSNVNFLTRAALAGRGGGKYMSPVAATALLLLVVVVDAAGWSFSERNATRCAVS